MSSHLRPVFACLLLHPPAVPPQINEFVHQFIGRDQEAGEAGSAANDEPNGVRHALRMLNLTLRDAMPCFILMRSDCFRRVALCVCMCALRSCMCARASSCLHPGIRVCAPPPRDGISHMCVWANEFICVGLCCVGDAESAGVRERGFGCVGIGLVFFRLT